MKEDQVREHLNRSDIAKSMGPNGMHHKCWASWLLPLWGHSWLDLKGHGCQERFLGTGRKKMLILRRARRKIQGTASSVLASVLEKVMKWIIWKPLLKEVIWNSQHGFVKQKLCLIMPLYNEITSLVDEKRAGGDVYLDFSKAFNSVSHSILTG